MKAENRSDVNQVIGTCGITHRMWEGKKKEKEAAGKVVWPFKAI